MKQLKFRNENITYLLPSWEDLNNIAFRLSKKILKDGQEFDRIVTLAKGGWPMTRSLVDFLQIKEVASIGIKFYAGIGERREKPEIYQELPISVKGENVILFDDVADSGESLIFAKNYLRQKGVKKIKTATLFYKSKSKIEPDYWGKQTEDWIIFPFEIRESVEFLGGKWRKSLSQFSNKTIEEEILERFEKIGFEKGMVDFFWR